MPVPTRLQFALAPLFLAGLSALAPLGCNRAFQEHMASPAATRGSVDEVFLAKRLSSGLNRLCDRWFMRWAQRGERQLPELVIVLADFKNDTGVPLFNSKIESLLQQERAHAQRYQLVSALQWNEEEISCRLEQLRLQKWSSRAERGQSMAIFVAKARLFYFEHPFSRSRDCRLQLVWENPKTLAENDEIEELIFRVDAGA